MPPQANAVNSSFHISPWNPSVFSLVVFFILVLGVIVVLLAIASYLGVKNDTEEKLRPYESGIIPTGTARLLYPVPFFLVAIFFLIFDVEGVFIFSWAVACERLGWSGWLQMSFFIAVLLAGLLYILKKGGLAWGPKPYRK
jgi:NADH-quinone oxidoreductase subunit A